MVATVHNIPNSRSNRIPVVLGQIDKLEYQIRIRIRMYVLDHDNIETWCRQVFHSNHSSPFNSPISNFWNDHANSHCSWKFSEPSHEAYCPIWKSRSKTLFMISIVCGVKNFHDYCSSLFHAPFPMFLGWPWLSAKYRRQHVINV